MDRRRAAVLVLPKVQVSSHCASPTQTDKISFESTLDVMGFQSNSWLLGTLTFCFSIVPTLAFPGVNVPMLFDPFNPVGGGLMYQPGEPVVVVDDGDSAVDQVQVMEAPPEMPLSYRSMIPDVQPPQGETLPNIMSKMMEHTSTSRTTRTCSQFSHCPSGQRCLDYDDETRFCMYPHEAVCDDGSQCVSLAFKERGNKQIQLFATCIEGSCEFTGKSEMLATV